MRRLRDILNSANRRSVIDAVQRRLTYYGSRIVLRSRHRRITEAYLNKDGSKRLHLGSGGHRLDGWLNSDILDLKAGMIFLDVRDRFPVGDNTFHVLYSEHLVEHLSYEDGVHYFMEAFRVLKPGGTCRTSTPDLSFLINLMQEDSEENRAYTSWAFRTYWPRKKPSRALAVNHYFRSWGHQCLYDYPLLKETYEAVGFREVRRVSVGESQIPELRGIEKHGDVIGERWNRKESLVVEGTKPGNPMC